MLAVLDLDGTLVDRDAGFRTWLAGFAAEHGLDDAGFSVWISHGRRWPEALRPPAVTVETLADALSFYSTTRRHLRRSTPVLAKPVGGPARRISVSIM